MRDHRDARVHAALDDAAAKRAVVERTDRDLNRGHGSELERLVQLRAADVREPDVLDEAVVDETRECAHGGSPRRSRIGRVDEIEIDRKPVERREARLAVRANRFRSTVGNPCAARTSHASLRHDARALARTARAESAREQRLVVAELIRAETVRMRGVEHRHARAGRSGDRLERDVEVAVLVRRQPHAPETHTELQAGKP